MAVALSVNAIGALRTGGTVLPLAVFKLEYDGTSRIIVFIYGISCYAALLNTVRSCLGKYRDEEYNYAG